MPEKIFLSGLITITSSGGLIIFDLHFQSIESFIGACVSLSSFAVLWYYSHKRMRSMEEQVKK